MYPTILNHNDHGVIERFVYAALRDLDGGDIELQALRKEFKFLCRHADRRNNALAFLKCQLFKPSGQECHHCTSNPPSPCSAYDYEKSIGGFMFDPVPSEEHECHFKTYLEMVSMENSNYKGEPQELGRCAICPNWWYSSQTEIKRHRRILHPKVPMEDIVAGDSKYNTKESKLFYCRFKLNGKICNLTFSSYHQLYTHRNKCGHKRNRKRTAEVTQKKEEMVTKKICHEKEKIEAFFQSTSKVRVVDKEQEETEESEIESCEGDMEDRCEADNCRVDELDGALIEWIECDECGGWWHTFCLCVKKVPKTFICKKM